MVGAEHRAETPEAGHDLVGDQQDIVLLEDRLDRLPIAGRRRHDAAGPEHRLADESGDRVGALALDQRLQLAHAMRDEVRLAHREVGPAKVVGRLGVEDAVERQVELLVEELQPGERAGDEPRAVIAAPARDDLLLLGALQDIVVVPDELDVGLVGVGAAEPEIDARHVGRSTLDDHLGERDRGLRAVADIGVVVGELLGLLRDRVGDFLSPVADIDAIEARQRRRADACRRDPRCRRPSAPVTIRLGLSPRACLARCVDGWKKCARSHRSSWSLLSIVSSRCSGHDRAGWRLGQDLRAVRAEKHGV